MRHRVIMLALLLFSCGPRVSEVRMGLYPPRPAKCSITPINATAAQMSPLGPYRVVGQIVIQESGAQNPFSERYAKILWPRACAMGGEFIALGVAGISQGGSGMSYVVLRRKQRPQPKKAEQRPQAI